MSAELTEDLDFIRNVREWPAYPFLPVKRDGMKDLSDENFGTVIAKGLIPIPVVLMIDMFSIGRDTNFNTVKKIEYQSVEELLLEWVVD